MKYIAYIVIFFCISFAAYSQSWIDLKKPEIIKDGTGLSSNDQAFAIYEDASGNLYHTGYFEGEIQFGNTTLESFNGRSLFLAKVNKNGGWDWAVSATSTASIVSRDINSDNSGNLYITGYFSGSATFGNNTITAMGNSDVFIVKISNNGNWIWAKAAIGNSFNRGNSVAADNSGNIYLPGSFETTVFVGNRSLVSSGGRDLFVSKLNSDGNWLWAIKAGGNGTEESSSIKFNSTNSFLAITGYYSSNTTFGQTTLQFKGSRDIYVSAIDLNGNWLWASSAATTGIEEAKALAMDAAGNSVITGYYTSTISFGDNNLAAGSGRDVFVAKIDKNGNWLWANSANGTNNDEGSAIGLDNSGNAYITGYFTTDIKFGNTNLTTTADRSMIVARISSAGAWSWGRGINGTSIIEGFGISVASNGISYITGYLFDEATLGNTTISSRGESDLFVGRMSSSGFWSWAYSNGGVTGVVTGEGTAVDSSGNILICGSFYGAVRFGNDTLRSKGSSDIFIAKYSAAGNWMWAKSYGGSDADIARSVAVDSVGNIFLAGSFQGDVNFGGINRQSNGFTDAFVMRLSSNGVTTWVNSAGDFEFDDGINVICKNDYILFSGNYSRRPFFGATRLTAKGNDDIFVSKLNKNGNYIWTISAGSSQYEYLNDVTIDNDDNIIITGGFENTCYFSNITVTTNGGDDIFVAKANSDGEWQWAKSAGTSSFQEAGFGVSYDENNNIYLASNYRSLCQFGDTYLLNSGLSDIAVSKLAPDGNWLWSKAIGGSGADFAYDLVYSKGKILIAGSIGNTFSINNKQFISNGTRNAFLAALDTTGSLIWVKSDESNGSSDIRKISYDLEGNSVSVGNFTKSIKLSNIVSNEANSVDRNAFFAINGFILEKPNWTYADSTGKSSTIKIPKNIQPKVNGREFVNGDAVGVFYLRNNNPFCAGMGYWKDDDLEITVWGNNVNTPVKDGFADNEKYNIVVWDALLAQEVPYNVRFASGPKNFQNGATSVVSQLPIIYDTLTIQLKQGWNLISANLEFVNPALDSVFSAVKQLVTIVKSNNGETFIPEFDINSIGNWDIKQGYQVYVKQNTNLICIGDNADPSEVNYSLNQGWHIISYLRNSEMDIAVALKDLVDSGKLVIAKSNDGETFIPEFDINSIGNMKTGQAYQIYLSGTVEFSYPPND